MTQELAPLIEIAGVLLDHPGFGRMANGREHATCAIRVLDPVGEPPLQANLIWPLIVLRPPAVELLRAAMPGDVLDLLGTIQTGRILVPRTHGRVDVLLVQ